MSAQIMKCVTVTGADDNVSIADMIAIQKQFPFVEWGILLSGNCSFDNTQTTRFPGIDWLRHLTASQTDARLNKSDKLNLSGHLCGQFVRHALTGCWPDLTPISEKFPAIFQRWQLNTHAIPHVVDYNLFDRCLTKAAENGQTIIFQIDGVNNNIAEHCRQRGHKNIAGLFDLSHGAGVLPDKWPQRINGIACGFAGGLSPENVAGQLENIGLSNLLIDTWIDAETHLRDAYRRFDLAKVVRFLEAAAPWVKG